jgi:hypothetical protein
VNPNPASSLSQSDRDQEIVAWNKHVLRPEITLGNELINDNPPHHGKRQIESK